MFDPTTMKVFQPAGKAASSAPVGPNAATPAKRPAPLPLEFAPQVRHDELGSVLLHLHIGDGAGAESHVDMWHDIFKGSGIAFLVVLRSRAIFELVVRTRPHVRCVYAKSAQEAETLVNLCDNLRAVFYVSNTGNVVHFIRFPHLTHIFIGHGDSEKAASCHKFFRAYDEVWTAGQAHIDRFHNTGLDFRSIGFVVVGRPSVRPLLTDAGGGERRGAFLYLPTWENFHREQGYSSTPLALDILAAAHAASGDSAVVKLHPWTGSVDLSLGGLESRLGQATAASGIPCRIVPKEAGMSDLMPEADYLIADVSSVITDFLPTKRPIFLYMPDRAIRLATSKMALGEYCYVFGDSAELAALVRSVIVERRDHLKDARLRAIDYFIGIRETVANQIWSEMLRVSRHRGAAGPTALFPLDAALADTAAQAAE